MSKTINWDQRDVVRTLNIKHLSVKHQASKMKCFAKIVNHFWTLTIFPKLSMLVVWHCSDDAYINLYAPVARRNFQHSSAFSWKSFKFFYNIFKALQIATEHGEASKKSNILARKSLIRKYIVISINASNGFTVNDFVCYENLIVCLILTYGTVKVYRLFSKISH